MAYDPVCRWTKSPSSNVNQYNVAWTYNGAAAGTATVAQNGSLDIIGYSRNFSADNPTVVLHAGDTVSVTVTTDDTVDGLLSAPVSAGPVTVPASPPAAPASVTLSLT